MKRFKGLISILLMIFIIAICGYVSAFSASMKLESSSKLKVGDTVEVTLKISNIDAGAGIDAIAATLEYDKNVFEVVTKDGFTGVNNWSLGIYSEDTQMLTVLRPSKVNNPGVVLKVSLKVKDLDNINSTIIKFKELSASGGALVDGGTGEIEISDAQVTVNKEVINNIDNNQNVNKQNTVKNQIITNNSDIANGKLPQTGSIITLGIGILIITFLLITVISYIRYKKLRIK